MKALIYISTVALSFSVVVACSSENKLKDRSDARDMFCHITALTKSYISKVEAAQDSAAWAAVCLEFEDSLDKVNFRYPADTDLLLSEGQNDTICNLMQTYVKVRDERLKTLMSPVAVPTDSLSESAPTKTSGLM